MSAKRSHGQGSKVRKRKDGRYTANIMYAGRRYYVYARTATEARAKLGELRKAHDAGEPLARSRVTVDEHLTSWLDGIAPTVAPQTHERYETLARRQLRPTLGAIRLAELQPSDIRRLYARLAETLAPQTVANAAEVLSAALNQAVRDGLVPRNVARGVALPRKGDASRPTLDGAAAVKLLQAAEGDPYAPVYALLLGSGLRIGEALALRWQDVDLEMGRLHVRGHLVRTAGKWRREPSTKTHRERSVMLTPLARAAIESTERTGALLFDRDGDVESPDRVRYRFRRVVAAAGLAGLRPHDLRHSVSTLLGAAGVNPRAVADLLGHKHVTMTLERYTHGEGLAVQAAERLGRLLPAGLGQDEAAG